MDTTGTGNAESVYAVYEKVSGKIISMHRSIVVPGAETPSRGHDEANAARHASKASGLSVEELAVIPVDRNDIHQGHRYYVDVVKKELREVPRD